MRCKTNCTLEILKRGHISCIGTQNRYIIIRLEFFFTFSKYDTKLYKGYFFRIGAATLTKSKGVAGDQIYYCFEGGSPMRFEGTSDIQY